MVTKDDLTVDQKAVLLSIASLNKKYSRFRIYFEKFLFLLTKSLPDLLEDLNDTFEAYKMGPYNEYADEILDGLRDYNLLTSEKGVSDEGKRVVSELREDQESTLIIQKIAEINETLEGLNVDDVLYLTYNLYPDFAKESVIAKDVKSEKLETFKLKVNNISEGQTLTIRSDKGNNIKLKRDGNRLTIVED